MGSYDLFSKGKNAEGITHPISSVIPGYKVNSFVTVIISHDGALSVYYDFIIFIINYGMLNRR